VRDSSGELRSIVVGEAWIAAARRGRDGAEGPVVLGGGVSSLRVRSLRVDIMVVMCVCMIVDVVL